MIFSNSVKTNSIARSAFPHLVQTGGQAGFLGGGEDEGLVMTVNHFVWNPLKIPRTFAHFV